MRAALVDPIDSSLEPLKRDQHNGDIVKTPSIQRVLHDAFDAESQGFVDVDARSDFVPNAIAAVFIRKLVKNSIASEKNKIVKLVDLE